MNALRLTLGGRWLASAATLALAFAVTGCAPAAITSGDDGVPRVESDRDFDPRPPNPDPRVGLSAGLFDAGQATWNMRLLSTTPPPEAFLGVTNSDLAFSGPFAIQGNYNGIIVWDISNPRAPELVTAYVCPASQSDVSVYENLMFVSGEGLGGRLDCGTEGVQEAVSQDRLRGIRIFDISDIRNPQYIANVQTCRGSHTHSVLKDPDDDENVYVYVSGSAPVRPAEEVPGCSGASPDEDPNSALFRIEVIRVPLANPAAAAIVSSPRIFNELAPAERHGLGPADLAEIEAARARGAFVVDVGGQPRVLGGRQLRGLLERMVSERGGTGEPTAADSAALRERLPELGAEMFARQNERVRTGPTQCHDITLYPHLGLAGGACEGYGMLLDIRDPANPVRLQAVADTNFSYWHSATFNNDGTTILFSDEWGGGGGAKCRADDPREWGADAIFAIENGRMVFRSYYKLPAPQTAQENCVAHNGSLVPIPGRDVMVQGWYQGGVSVFDFTDPGNPYEIAFFDRGPADAEVMRSGGSWSVYWYNGAIVNSEISRGLDVLELTPSAHLSANELEAARTVVLDELNPQGQPRFTWPPSFALVRAYVDQLERSGGLAAGRIEATRDALDAAEAERGSARSGALTRLAAEIDGEAGASGDARKVRMLAAALRDLAGER
jgi:hypothetical protein